MAHHKDYVIDGVTENVFTEVLKFIYTDVADITEQNENELLAAAKKFELKGLMQQVYMHQNLKNNPLQLKELDSLKLKFEEAKYLYDKAKERLSIKNPFNRAPCRYY